MMIVVVVDYHGGVDNLPGNAMVQLVPTLPHRRTTTHSATSLDDA
jgi:hypothetical protein